jgi:WD40 repeat protein
LARALEAREIESYVDRRRLPFLVPWQKELREAIARSDSLVFVVSPTSVASDWCRWEIKQAVDLNKRLAPVAAVATSFADLPAEVSAIQLLPMTSAYDFERQADILASALKIDAEWVKEHTRLAERATRWEAGGRTDGEMLRGRELREAELWISSRQRDAPEPTGLHRAYIQASRVADQQRIAREEEQVVRTRRFQRGLSWTLAALFGVLVMAAVAVLMEMRATFVRESLVFASQSDQAWDRGECDSSARYALAGLPGTMSNPLAPWSPVLEAQLVRALWPCRLKLRLKDEDAPIESAAFSRDGARIAVGVGTEAQIRDLSTGRLQRRLTGHSGRVTSVEFTADGHRALTASADGTARVWDADTGKELYRLALPEEGSFEVHFLADDTRIVSYGYADVSQGTLRVWSAGSGRLLGEARTGSTLPSDGRVFASHEHLILTPSNDRNVVIWNADTLQEVLRVRGDDIGVRSAAFSPASDRIVIGGDSHSAHILSASDGHEIATLEGHKNTISTVAYSPDGRFLVTGSWDDTAKIWDADGRHLIDLVGHEGWVICAMFNGDGERVVTGSTDGTVRVWETQTGRPLAVMRGHEAAIKSCDFAADASLGLSVSEDGSVRVWDTTRGRDIRHLKGHTDWVRSAAFSPDGKRIVSAAQDGTLRVWDPANGHELLKIETGEHSLEQAAFCPDQACILTAGDSAGASLWSISTLNRIARFEGHSGPVRAAAMSRDGTRVITASGSELGEGDETARIWETSTGRELLKLKGHIGDVMTAAFSPDGSRVVTGGDDKTAKVWDAKTGEALLDLRGHTGAVLSVAFDPSGKSIATGSADQTVRLWDAVTGALRRVLAGHGGRVGSVAFNPDGTRLISAGPDHTARVWDLATGIEIARLSGHDDAVMSASFSPDGRLAVTASDDKIVRIWDVVEASLLHGLEARTDACNRRLLGAASFTDREMKNPILKDREAIRDTCPSIGRPIAR